MVVTALLISCVFSQQTFPYLQLGTNLRNNSVVNLSSIGTTDQLRCVTDLDTCCSTAQGSAERAWILPNGTRLTQDGVQEISSFSVTAEESVLALQLTDLDVRSNPALSGIYECSIDTSSGQTQSVFVGLYYEPDAGKLLAAVRHNLSLVFHSLYDFDINKWKNHFVEMNGDVGMSVHEKGGKQVNATPTHKTIYNPIPTSL